MKINQIIATSIACLFSALIAVGIYNYFTKDKTVATPLYQSGGFENVSYTENTNTTPTPVAFDFTKAAKKGLPAVVHIKSYVEKTTTTQRQPSSIEELFEDFWGGRSPQQRQPQKGIGFGSGVIISADGYIITNNHVIEDAKDIDVSFYNDEVIKAELIGTDPTTDIALIKVDKKDLPYIQFADSDKVQVGEWVAAIGNPAVGPDAFALKSSVTAGIVSALGRNIGINTEQYRIESFIQTDAVINRGNSGGALVNINGDLIGINTAISTPTGVYAGYGFAVPANIARKVANDLKEFGEVKRALLGVTYQDIKDIRTRGGEIDTEEKEGLYIADVLPDGAADKAGLQPGDVIIALDGENILDGDRNLQEIVGTKRPGETVDVKYRRNGNTKTTRVKLLSAEETQENTNVIREARFVEDLGIGVEPLAKNELSEFDIDGGVKVAEITRNSILYRVSYGDVGPGFIITHVNQKPVNSVEDVRKAVKQTSQGMVKIDGFDEATPNARNSYSFPLR